MLRMNCSHALSTIAVASLALTVSCGDDNTNNASCIELTGAYVEGGTTLPAGTCYFADAQVNVAGGDLVIEEGVDIQLAAGVGISIQSDAKIIATGTEEDPIVFHGEDSVRGSWDGIQIRSVGSNTLDHVIVDGAGATEWYGGGNADGSVYVEADAALVIKNSTIRNGLGRGVLVRGSTLTIESTTITDCEVAGFVHPNAGGGIAADNVLTGNDDDRMWFAGGGDMSDAQTWNNIGIPWKLSERLILNAPLTVAAGTRIEAGQEVSLIVESEGRLTLAGTDGEEVVLAGEEDTPGYWKGINVKSKGQDNLFEYAEIANAGGGEWYGGGDAAASIYVESTGAVALVNTVIRGSANYGILASGGADLSGWSAVTFADNTKAAMLYPNLAQYVSSDTVFEGNEEQGVRLTFGNNDSVSDDQTWQALDVPYLITVRTFIKANLTIAAGAELRFFGGASMNVAAEGTLSALGEAGNEVVFTGLEETPGFWKGLEFVSTSVDNVLENTRVSYGGSDEWFGGGDAAGNIYLVGSLTLNDVTVDNGSGYGILLRNDAALTCNGVTFDSNGAGDASPDTTVCM